jgi:hypothetical protein
MIPGKEKSMSGLLEMLEGGGSSQKGRGYSEAVEVIKKYLGVPKLEGLVQGDVLR